eukprot:3235163-Lingulodinium_polyedra.AAC.1
MLLAGAGQIWPQLECLHHLLLHRYLCELRCLLMGCSKAFLGSSPHLAWHPRPECFTNHALILTGASMLCMCHGMVQGNG